VVGLGEDVVTAAEVPPEPEPSAGPEDEPPLLLPPPHAASDPARRTPARA
jgi:hypothetical protein